MVLAVNVSTESPFAYSKVETPPLGFSLRRAAPVRNSGQGIFPRELPRMEQTWPKNQPENQSMPRRLLTESKFLIGRRDADFAEGVRLRTNSELVYPDGHVSPVSSPM
jgi:hypothetical protein